MKYLRNVPTHLQNERLDVSYPKSFNSTQTYTILHFKKAIHESSTYKNFRFTSLNKSTKMIPLNKHKIHH